MDALAGLNKRALNHLKRRAFKPKRLRSKIHRQYRIRPGSLTLRPRPPRHSLGELTGNPCQASLSAPLIIHGVVIAPKGADVTGIVTNSDPGGRVKGVASLSLQLQGIRSADGQDLQVQTNSFVQQAKGTKKRDAVRTGIAAGAGAAIRAIAGGGRGAAIGAGVATNLATRGAPAELPAESVLEFTLADSAVITEIRPGSLAPKQSTTHLYPTASEGPTPVPLTAVRLFFNAVAMSPWAIFNLPVDLSAVRHACMYALNAPSDSNAIARATSRPAANQPLDFSKLCAVGSYPFCLRFGEQP
jgi:hypothetical protein